MWANLSLLSSDAFFAYLVGQQQISSAHLSGKRKKMHRMVQIIGMNSNMARIDLKGIPK